MTLHSLHSEYPSTILSMQSTPPFLSWSRFPRELADEIAGHNIEDVPTLGAMCLASKAMRLSAIEHLFSTVHFTCADDFNPWWANMLRRTPRLQTAVRKVRFSDKFQTEAWRMRHPGTSYPKQLHEAVIPPQIPIMPNVCVVEWAGDQDLIPISVAVAYMALFPNITELRLRSLTFTSMDDLVNLLGSCGRLRVLSTSRTDVLIDALIDRKSTPFDLSALEELEIEGYTCILPLIVTRRFRPAGLLSLRYLNFETIDIQAAESTLHLATPSLINLDLAPDLSKGAHVLRSVVEMFSRLPPLQALRTLSISLYQAQLVLNASEAPAPVLTRLILRIPLSHVDVDRSFMDLDWILQSVFPWGRKSESMRSALTRKFPLIRRLGFHFCVTRESPIHFRRRLRRRMEWQLMKRLEETGADVAKIVEVDWLDDKYVPVVYNGTTGKPRWKLALETPEPESEASDCELSGW
ncbi:hypothetical protein C8R47DRAFT_1319601 [Mycena vitilis]|nr:hypothetical protein C8R47DRAFT_1319601 [Mycena vitilis]